jgi:hypothetical protein
VDGRGIVHDGLTLPIERVPVTATVQNGNKLIGYAANFERNIDGVIWCDITLNPEEHYDLNQCSATIEVTDVRTSEEDGVQWITEGRLRCLHITHGGANGWPDLNPGGVRRRV